MKVKSEYHETQKTLFRRVNQIRQVKGTCDFEQEGNGYRLNYCEDADLDNTYIVQTGKDGAPFRFHNGMEGSFFYLTKGEVLVFEFEHAGKVWFSYPKWREGRDVTEMELDQDIGYTEYGSLSEMVQAGLIINIRHAEQFLIVTADGEMKEKPLEQNAPDQTITGETQMEVQPESIDAEPLEQPASKQADTEETQEEIQPETKDEQSGIPTPLARLTNSNEIKTALDKVRKIVKNCSKHNGIRIRTHQVMYRWYANGYSYHDGFKYTQAAQMRFGGRWLEKLGFEQEKTVKIIAMRDLIVIVPV